MLLGKLIKTSSPHAHRFELFDAGEKVSSLILFDYDFTYNSVILKMGGIAGVQTNKEHRNKGYAGQLMQATIEWMLSEKYHCSFLYGIPDFYWRYGFASILTHGATTVFLKDIEVQEDHGFGVRPFQTDDTSKIRQLYNHNNQNRMCSIIRGATWSGIPRGSDWDKEPQCLVVESSEGCFEGYAVFDKNNDKLIVSEVETKNPAAQYRILQALAEIGRERNQEKFIFVGATTHPFAIFARRFGATHNDYLERYGFGMGRLIDIKEFFKQITPELSRRSWLLPENISQVVTFDTEIGKCNLEIKRGFVQVVEKASAQTGRIHIQCSQLELTRLVFGVVDYPTFSVSKNTVVQGDPKATLTTLFPTQLNTIPPTSWF